MKSMKIKPQPLNLEMINKLPKFILGKRFNLEFPEENISTSSKKVKFT